jgi:DME family drug/metabolite transporter
LDDEPASAAIPRADGASGVPAARLQLAAAAVLFSTGGAAIKAIPFGGFPVAALRSLVAAIALFAFVPQARRIRAYGIWRLLPIAIAYAATLVLFVVANKLTTSANTIFLQSTAPLYLAFLAPVVLQEKIKSADARFMVALAAGLLLFFVGQEAPRISAPDPARGNVVAAVAGFTWALTLLGLRHLARRESSGDSAGAAPAAVALGNVVACGATLPFAWPLPALDGPSIATLVYLGAFQIGLAYALLTRGLARVPALESSLVLLLEPVLNPVWAFAIHREVPSPLAAAGCCVIFAATIARALADRPRRA